MNNIEHGLQFKSKGGDQQGGTGSFDDESLVGKLYISKDVEGGRNKEIIGTVQELSEKLEEQDPTIIGVAPYGSVVRGYNVKGMSDIDVYVLYDDGEETKKGERTDEVKSGAVIEETQEAFDTIYKQNKDLPPAEIAVNALNINPELISTRESGDLNYYRNVETYAPIFLVVTGKKINDYREYWAKKVSEMPGDQRDQFVDNSVYWLTHFADLNPNKLAERANISKEKLGEIIDAREDLWRKRVKRLLKIG